MTVKFFYLNTIDKQVIMFRNFNQNTFVEKEKEKIPLLTSIPIHMFSYVEHHEHSRGKVNVLRKNIIEIKNITITITDTLTDYIWIMFRLSKLNKQKRTVFTCYLVHILYIPFRK